MNLTHIFSAGDLALLQQRAIDRYQQSVVGHGTSCGAIIQVSGDTPADYTKQAMKLALSGHSLHETLSPSLGGAAGHYIGFFVKPDALQQEDLANLKIKVEADYRLELQRRYDETLQTVITESLAREQRAEEKKRIAAEEKLYARLLTEAQAELGQRPE